MLATYYSAPFLLHCYTASDGIKQFADILEQRSQPDKICITFFFWLVGFGLGFFVYPSVFYTGCALFSPLRYLGRGQGSTLKLGNKTGTQQSKSKSLRDLENCKPFEKTPAFLICICTATQGAE